MEIVLGKNYVFCFLNFYFKRSENYTTSLHFSLPIYSS